MHQTHAHLEEDEEEKKYDLHRLTLVMCKQNKGFG